MPNFRNIRLRPYHWLGYNCAPFLGGEMKQRKKEPLQLLQVGVGTMVSSMSIAGFILGYVTDWYLGTVPLFLLIFGFLGVLGGIMKAHQFLSHVPNPVKSRVKTARNDTNKEK